MNYLGTVIVVFLLIGAVLSENKYSRNVNEKKKKDVDFRTLEKPFRMNKLNLLWKKAQQRLTESKLKSLYSDLMIHDKEEITYKRMKSEGGDKEGLREAELRRKLSSIMSSYGLRQHFEDHKPEKHKQDPTFNLSDEHINKSLFKDKKLNQLWAKAESSGFTSEELSALKEEFLHHQEKIDQYYDLLNNMDADNDEGYKNAVNDDELIMFNEINSQLESNEGISKDFLDRSNLVRDHHRHLRDGFDRLNRITARGPNNKEFIEPKVQRLWNVASQANITVEELASLKAELHHYESRLLKLRQLQADHVSTVDKHKSKIAATGDKMDHFDQQQQMIKKHLRKVEKMHNDIENRILGKHTEL